MVKDALSHTPLAAAAEAKVKRLAEQEQALEAQRADIQAQIHVLESTAGLRVLTATLTGDQSAGPETRGQIARELAELREHLWILNKTGQELSAQQQIAGKCPEISTVFALKHAHLPRIIHIGTNFSGKAAPHLRY